MTTQVHGRLFDRFLLGDRTEDGLGWDLAHTPGLGHRPTGGERSGRHAGVEEDHPLSARVLDGEVSSSLLRIAAIPTCPRMGTNDWFERGGQNN